MNEREFITQFTSEYSQLMNSLELSDRYKDNVTVRKQLIVDCYNNILKPLVEGYLNIEIPEIKVSQNQSLDMQHTPFGMVGWLHWRMKDYDLKKR